MSTGCEFHADALAELAAERLDRVREGRVREHLSSCASCREDLEVLRAVARAEATFPAGLERRIRAAVRESGVGTERAPAPVAGARPGGRGDRWRPAGGWRQWALPLAAAATVAVIWLGVPDRPRGGAGDEVTVAADAYAPWGAWPGEGPEVAGAPVLTELSAEDLELLLERMDP